MTYEPTGATACPDGCCLSMHDPHMSLSVRRAGSVHMAPMFSLKRDAARPNPSSDAATWPEPDGWAIEPIPGLDRTH